MFQESFQAPGKLNSGTDSTPTMGWEAKILSSFKTQADKWGGICDVTAWNIRSLDLMICEDLPYPKSRITKYNIW